MLASVAESDTTLRQHRDKSMCLLGLQVFAQVPAQVRRYTSTQVGKYASTCASV